MFLRPPLQPLHNDSSMNSTYSFTKSAMYLHKSLWPDSSWAGVHCRKTPTDRSYSQDLLHSPSSKQHSLKGNVLQKKKNNNNLNSLLDHTMFSTKGLFVVLFVTDRCEETALSGMLPKSHSASLLLCQTAMLQAERRHNSCSLTELQENQNLHTSFFLSKKHSLVNSYLLASSTAANGPWFWWTSADLRPHTFPSWFRASNLHSPS